MNDETLLAAQTRSPFKARHGSFSGGQTMPAD
jgi:hypothetical protein